MNIVWQPATETFAFHCRNLIIEEVPNPLQIVISTRSGVHLTILDDWLEPNDNDIIDFNLQTVLVSWLETMACIQNGRVYNEAEFDLTIHVRDNMGSGFELICDFTLLTGPVGTGENYTIEQSPVLYSFIENCNDIIIATTQPQIITIKKNDEFFLEEHYYPFNGYITIKTKDLLRDFFYSKKPSFNPFLQSNNSYKFSFFIANNQTADFEFIAISGGVKVLNNINTFVLRNFFTIQPQILRINKNTTHYLNFFLFEDYATQLLVRAYTTDSNYIEYSNLQLTNLDYFYTYAFSYNSLKSIFHTDFIKVDFILKYTSDNINYGYSFPQRFTFDKIDSINDDYFVFENSLGGLDTICFNGLLEFSEEHKTETYLVNSELMEYKNNLSIIYKKNTGYFISKEHNNWASEFFKSKKRYHIVDGILKDIVVAKLDAKNVPLNLNDYTFEFEYSEEKNLHSIERVEVLP